jgi:hypothetical protein
MEEWSRRNYTPPSKTDNPTPPSPTVWALLAYTTPAHSTATGAGVQSPSCSRLRMASIRAPASRDRVGGYPSSCLTCNCPLSLLSRCNTKTHDAMVALTSSSNTILEYHRHYMPFECWIQIPRSNGSSYLSYSVAYWDLVDRRVFTIQAPPDELHCRCHLLLQQTDFNDFDKSSDIKQRTAVNSQGRTIYLSVVCSLAEFP